MGLRQGKFALGSCRSTSGPDVVDDNCTTRRGNAHSTEIGQEREVLYPWHPWAECIVLVHAAVEKLDGTVLHCSREGGSRERWLELPAWMFDRASADFSYRFLIGSGRAGVRGMVASAPARNLGESWRTQCGPAKVIYRGTASGQCAVAVKRRWARANSFW